MATLPVRISKIIANPAGFDRLLDKKGRYLGPFTNLNEEYVELYNDSNKPANISGWLIEDQNHHRYYFPANTVIGPHKTLQLHSGLGINITDKFGNVHLYWGRKAPVWNNPGDVATLRDFNNNIVLRKASGALSLVYGTVTDIENTPLNEATVATANVSDTTDQDGSYSLSVVPGRHKFTASKSGYKSESETKIIPVQGMELNFQLKKLEGEKSSPAIHISVKGGLPDFANWKEKYHVISNFVNDGDTTISDFKYIISETSEGKTKDVQGFSGRKDKGEKWTVDKVFRQDWIWWTKDLTGTMHKGITEKKFSYDIWYGANGRAENLFDYQNTVPLGTITISVEDKKLSALDHYNEAYWGTIVGGAVAGAAAGSVVPGIGTAAGAAAGFIVGLVVDIVSSVAQSGLTGQFEQDMNDPPSLDKKYKTMAKPRLEKIKVSKQLVGHIELKKFVAEYKKFISLHDVLMVTNNRIFTAETKKDKLTFKKQKEHRLKIKNKISKSLSNLDKLCNKVKRKYKNVKISKAWFVKAKRQWAKSGFPKNFDKNLAEFGFGKIQIKTMKTAILHLPISKLEFDLLCYMKTIVQLSKKL